MFCLNNEIETCQNCNLFYFKYSPISIHKLSELSFLTHYLLVLILLLQGLLFGSISNATAINARTYNVLVFIIPLRIDDITTILQNICELCN